MRGPTPALLSVAAGIALGVGAFTFLYARGASYLTDAPEACANCHVMQRHFIAWQAASHRAAAVCNDCHTPHDLLGKWTTKALNGLHHSLAFTTGHFPDAIRITARNRTVTEATCRSCHGELVASISRGEAPGHGQAISCLQCHRDVGHGS